ncbi:MAG: DUF4091 domain-containing protein, partial [Oscillospiraceae bacterium]
MLTVLQTSSLEKVLPKLKCDATAISGLSALIGETVSYQIAYMASNMEEYSVTLTSDIADNIKIYDVKNVPVELPTTPEGLADDNYISHEPGLFPDALIPRIKPSVKAGCWYKALWITIDGAVPAGEHTITVKFEQLSNNGENDYINFPSRTTEFVLKTINAVLPPQKLKVTQWFHADCIYSYYGIEALSDKHWELIEKFMQMAVKNGINTILTPIFTPPLDTEIGGERPTIQLVEIHKDGNNYNFKFENLDRWVAICKKCGMQYLEMAHLFTQWGAKFTPKIMAYENGEYKRIFGWDVEAQDSSYAEFLAAFLPALLAKLDEYGMADKTYFHISDEPSDQNLEGYLAAKNIVQGYLKGYKIIDALSHYDFYKAGIVENPVVAVDCVKPFLENNVEDLWVYYCCGQVNGVSNRFMAMPSCRNRFIGFQLYKYNIDGFLQWGYNFYYAALSKGLISPYLETDACGAFSAGDAFSVYPEDDGPCPSLRLLVFNEALQDLRAMQLLEKYAGHEAVVEMLTKEFGGEIVF